MFPDHATHLHAATEHLDAAEKDQLRTLLKKLGTGMASEAPAEGTQAP